MRSNNNNVYQLWFIDWKIHLHSGLIWLLDVFDEESLVEMSPESLWKSLLPLSLNDLFIVIFWCQNDDLASIVFYKSTATHKEINSIWNLSTVINANTVELCMLTLHKLE